MYRRSRFHHTLSSRPRAEGEIFVMGFPSSSPSGKSDRSPLSPSPGLSYRAETTLLNKLAFLSTTTGRFCSWCHVLCLFSVSLACDHILPCIYGNITEKKLRLSVPSGFVKSASCIYYVIERAIGDRYYKQKLMNISLLF